MRIFSRVLLLILLALGLLLAVVLYYTLNPKLPDYVPVEQVHYQEQWSEADRQTYYFTPQGTQVKGLHYDWFTALELPFSNQRFATPDYLARFGFLVDPKQVPSAQNPGNLPVGFARHQNADSKVQYLDITCAACHTGELHFKNQALRIERWLGPACAAVQRTDLARGSFGQALVASLAATYYLPLKFDRFRPQRARPRL